MIWLIKYIIKNYYLGSSLGQVFKRSSINSPPRIGVWLIDKPKRFIISSDNYNI